MRLLLRLRCIVTSHDWNYDVPWRGTSWCSRCHTVRGRRA